MVRKTSRFPRPLAIAGLLASLTGCGAAPNSGAPAASVAVVSPSPSADDTFVADLEIAGRRMHIVCLGPTNTGRPTVIFEAGLGGDFGVWAGVLTTVSKTNRGCSYDRAGDGMSEPASAPRTTTDQVDDLRALLAQARIAPPYLLVGHSSGAWNVLVHADRHPDDVMGAVLVDPRPPTASARFLAALPPETAGEPDLIHQYREGYTAWESDPSRNPEHLDLADSAIEAEGATGLGSKPLIVLAAVDDEGDGSDLDPALAATFDSIWSELQEQLATRSTTGRFVPVANTGHDMPDERPDAIVDAINEVLGD
jgi:pimeloyl-ACP methyl ester carboxylesterase